MPPSLLVRETVERDERPFPAENQVAPRLLRHIAPMDRMKDA